MQLSIFKNEDFAPCPTEFNMARHTLGHGKTPDKIALEVISAPGLVSESWTYAALQETVLRSAHGLMKRGITAGNRVPILVGNRSDFPILFFALNALGAVPVPLSSVLTRSEILYILTDLQADALIADRPVKNAPCQQIIGGDIEQLRLSEPIYFAPTKANDDAYIVYTSGTGGTPKGVVHAQRAAWARRMMWDGWYGLRHNDRMLHAGAFNWTYTLGAGLTDPWAIGATALIYTGEKTRNVWANIAAAHRPTIFAAAPGVYRQLLSSNTDLTKKFDSLRHGISAGEKLPVSLMQDWVSRSHKPVYEALGMTEISTFISHSPKSKPRSGTSGLPQFGRQIAILSDTGELADIDTEGLLAVHHTDQGLMKNYLHQPAIAPEWFITGDRAKMDSEGYISHLGRADDVLNAGGFRVSPQEICATLLTLDGVTDCVAMEILVKKDTKVIAAFYTGDQQTDTELKTHCSLTLAAYKCPRYFVHLDTLPRSENGKLLKSVLQKKYDWKADDHA